MQGVFVEIAFCTVFPAKRICGVRQKSIDYCCFEWYYMSVILIGYGPLAQLVEQRSPKPRAEGSSPSAPAKIKRHLRVSFYFVVKAEELEPRNSKVPALLTVNSPVDCLRIELIIKPLPKKAPIFRCFFPLFTLFYGVFTCFSHIDKITAHGLFRTP